MKFCYEILVKYCPFIVVRRMSDESRRVVSGEENFSNIRRCCLPRAAKEKLHKLSLAERLLLHDRCCVDKEETIQVEPGNCSMPKIEKWTSSRTELTCGEPSKDTRRCCIRRCFNRVKHQ